MRSHREKIIERERERKKEKRKREKKICIECYLVEFDIIASFNDILMIWMICVQA